VHILESFFNNRVRNSSFYPRKLSLPDEGSFHLHGARGVGKSALVIDYLQTLPVDSWLYIDCQDPVFALEDIDSDLLDAFLQEEAIETLVLDHYYAGFLDRLPARVRIIIVTRQPRLDHPMPSLELFGLDYEEFLSWGRDYAPAQRFNRFLKAGTLPAMALHDPGALELTLRPFFLAAFDEDESRMMLILARYQGHHLSIHQLYRFAREYFRISKDRVYETIKRFTEEKLIFFIENAEGKGAGKMILYDHALAGYLSKEQPFSVRFDSLVALALIKHGFDFRALGRRGYLYNYELIIPAPFETEEQAWTLVYKQIPLWRKHAVKQAWFVTVSNRFRFELGGIVCEGLPFYEWSIVNEYSKD